LNIADVVGDTLDEEEAEIMVLEDPGFQINGPGGQESVSSYDDSDENGSEMPSLTPFVHNVYYQASSGSSNNYKYSLTDVIQKFKSPSYDGRKVEMKTTMPATHRQSDRPCPATFKTTQEGYLADPSDSPLTDSLSGKSIKHMSPLIGEAVNDLDTGEMVHPCLMCDKKYKLKSSLEAHVKVHEGSDNTCSICGQIMSRSRDLKRHVATLHNGLLHPDGSITYPPDIHELIPPRRKKIRKNRPSNRKAALNGNSV
jgi:uncharacterized C2H2 Zn-finger protein